jgi:SnoaL-like domain
MGGNGARERAAQPEDLGRFFVERANAGDVDGLVALYEPDAVLALPAGQVTTGSQAIRRVYERLLADRPTFTAGSSGPRSAMATWRSPPRGWPAVGPRSRWLAASRTAPGSGRSTSRTSSERKGTDPCFGAGSRW